MRCSNWFAIVVGLGVVLGFISFGTAGNTKVSVCHIPPDSPGNFHTIVVSEDARLSHLAHGDKDGECGLFAESLCNDSNACTIDSFLPGTTTCTPIADRTLVDCDDGNPYTADSCDKVQGCINTPTAPPVPSNFHVVSTSTTSVVIYWDDTPNETYYEIGWGPGAITSSFTVPAGTTSQPFTSLASGVSWHFNIRACNTAGCSAWHGDIGCTPGSGCP